MADNFSLRQFLTENKLTKNTQLLKEEEAPQGADISGYWVLYSGMNAPRFLQFIKMFPSEQQAQQALDDAPKKYGEHVLRQNWGIISAEEWLEDGYELDSSREGHPDYQSPKRLTPDEQRKADAEFNQIRQDFYEQKQPNKMTNREKYLTRLVENALGLQVTEDDNVDYTMGNQDDPNQLPNPAPELNIPEGEEMVQEKPMPKYENIEKLMQEIDKSTDEAAHKYKMEEMKRVADGLEKKATSLEEGDDSDHIDQKKLKQMKKDIMSLRKNIEKMEKLAEKKFTKKETKAEIKETKMETTFDLKKFLVENKLTYNSRLLNEEIADSDIQVGAEYTAMLATDTKGGRTPVKVKVLGRDRSDDTKVVVTPLQDVDYKNAESGEMNKFTKGSHYGSEAKYLSK